jgi:hypothetical protein
MRRAVFVLALCTAGMTGCAAIAMARGGPDPRTQLQQGLEALEQRDYTRARGFLEPLYQERWTEPVGRHAMLALIAAELDTRNPDRRLWAGADRAARLVNVPQIEPWMIPVVETYYLLALELGAQEERLAQADSARLAAEQRARAATQSRTLPANPRETVPTQIRRLTSDRDAQRRRADQAEQQLAARERELRETKQELERIKRTIKP